MSLASKNLKSVHLPSAVAILYFGVQWLGASTMGGCRIFSLSMGADRADFAMMVNQISTAARVYCTSISPQAILFGDEDVVTPYIVGVADPLGHCEVVRSTRVTPFTDAEVEGCGNLLVAEFSPPQSEDLKHRIETDLDGQARQWAELDRWASGDGRYGFTIYRHPCATPGNGKE
jgi:hypothetical protein